MQNSWEFHRADTSKEEFKLNFWCPRCPRATSHVAILAKRFKNPPEFFTYWTLCPETQEPVLVRLEYVPDSNGRDIYVG